MTSRGFDHDLVVIGGCGRVGLPLAIAFAERGLRTLAYDVSDEKVKLVNDARLPFDEPGAAGPLAEAIGSGTLVATTDPASVSTAENVVFVIGTPLDEHLNPDPRAIPRALALCGEELRDGQLLVLRSTVYPGVTAMVERLVRDLGREMDIAFCPERIAEGFAMTELYALPQIVGSRTPRAAERAERLFRALTDDVVHVTPEEAEFAKLFTNTWRYVKFAVANQFFEIANDAGIDYERVRAAVTHEYPRAADLPSAGFTAGPCLFKDTMQLAAFNNNAFTLGHAAMLVNEGLPLYLVSRLEQRYDLTSMTVGILGMSFKAGSDDTRSSLSYQLRRILEFRCRRALTTDPYVTTDPRLLPLDEVVAQSDLLVLATPHPEYRTLETDVPVVDVWNLLGKGVVV